jgi:hypothetical protein
MAGETKTEAGGRLVDRDLGYRRFVANLAKLRKASTGGPGAGPGVLVGVRDAAGSDEDGTPLVQIAAVHEFGSSDGHTPERSFLRSTVDVQGEAYAVALVAVLDAARKAPIGAGNAVIRRGLGRLGAKAVGDVKRTITDLDTPPNAPSTVERKGSSNPLIDTGRLRQSIDFEVRGI